MVVIWRREKGFKKQKGQDIAQVLLCAFEPKATNLGVITRNTGVHDQAFENRLYESGLCGKSHVPAFLLVTTRFEATDYYSNKLESHN